MMNEKTASGVSDVSEANANEASRAMYNSAQALSSEETVGDVLGTLTEEQQTVVYELIGRILQNDDDTDDGFDKEAAVKVFDSLTEKQKTVVYAFIGQALLEGVESGDETDPEKEEIQNE